MKEAGRESRKVFVYDLYDKGRSVGSFNSEAEFSRHYGFNKNRMSVNRAYGNEFFFFETFIASNTALSQSKLNDLKLRENSPYYGKGKTQSDNVECGWVEVKNLDGESIAHFKSPFYATKMMGLNTNVRNKLLKSGTHTTREGLVFTLQTFK